jgi:hypothetical protein
MVTLLTHLINSSKAVSNCNLFNLAPLLYFSINLNFLCLPVILSHVSVQISARSIKRFLNKKLFDYEGGHKNKISAFSRTNFYSEKSLINWSTKCRNFLLGPGKHKEGIWYEKEKDDDCILFFLLFILWLNLISRWATLTFTRNDRQPIHLAWGQIFTFNTL